jgi:hypothetical protein
MGTQKNKKMLKLKSFQDAHKAVQFTVYLAPPAARICHFFYIL